MGGNLGQTRLTKVIKGIRTDNVLPTIKYILSPFVVQMFGVKVGKKASLQ